MIASRHITRLVAALMAAAVCLCLVAVGFSDGLSALNTGVAMAYETKLFNVEEVISVNILMESEAWEEMLASAATETYYQCDVEINGTTFSSVAIRPKGNTSLTAIAADPNSDRYSFKLEFDRYVSGQSCFGLDKLILNNNYADATNMKEALVYDMYQYLGADASLYNYAEVSVNGEYWGVYLALEAVEDSFLLRNYGAQSGELYKPDSMQMGFGEDASGFTAPPSSMPDGDFSPPEGFSMEDMPDMSAMGEMPDIGERPDMDASGFGGGFSMGGGGANLNYIDDDLDSYSTIWEGSVTNTTAGDHRRVVTALEHISEGSELETYLDVDNVLRYMAVHVFVNNQDSLSGAMAHNYYLYESGGQLNMLPWDYNLAFGGMSMGSVSGASEVVNDPIDTPFSGTNFFDALLEDEAYSARYHAYLQQLADEYVDGGGLDAFYARVRSQIDGLVETDPTAFYTFDEYDVGAAMLYDTVKLRAQSVRGQLDGTIPSTTAGQRADSSALVDAAAIDVESMGVFNMGGSFGGGGFSFSGRGGGARGANVFTDGGAEGMPDDGGEATEAVTLSSDTANGPHAGGVVPEGFAPSGGAQLSADAADMPDFTGEVPEGFTPPDGTQFDASTLPDFGGEMPEGFTPSEGTQADASGAAETAAMDPSGAEAEGASAVTSEISDTDGAETTSTANGSFSTDFGSFSMEGFDPSALGFGSTQTASQSDTLLLYGACLLLLLAALVFATRFRRRSPRR